jgi:hypothetical protein
MFLGNESLSQVRKRMLGRFPIFEMAAGRNGRASKRHAATIEGVLVAHASERCRGAATYRRHSASFLVSQTIQAGVLESASTAIEAHAENSIPANRGTLTRPPPHVRLTAMAKDLDALAIPASRAP